MHCWKSTSAYKRCSLSLGQSSVYKPLLSCYYIYKSDSIWWISWKSHHQQVELSLDIFETSSSWQIVVNYLVSVCRNRSCNIRDDSVFTVAAPAVDSDSLRVYKAFVERGTLGAVTCQRENYDVYKKYLRRLWHCIIVLHCV